MPEDFRKGIHPQSLEYIPLTPESMRREFYDDIWKRFFLATSAMVAQHTSQLPPPCGFYAGSFSVILQAMFSHRSACDNKGSHANFGASNWSKEIAKDEATGVAAFLRVSREYITRLETGKHDPSLSTLTRLAKVLKVKVAELLG